MSKEYKDFVSTSLSIEDKEKRIKKLTDLKNITLAHKMYMKGFYMGVIFSTICVFVILGVVYLGTHYEFIF